MVDRKIPFICEHCNQTIIWKYINDKTKCCPHNQNVLECLVCDYHKHVLK